MNPEDLKTFVEWLETNIEVENDLYQAVAHEVDINDLHKESYYIEKMEKHFQRAAVFEEVLEKIGFKVK